MTQQNASSSLHEMLQRQLIAEFSALRVGARVASDRELAARYGVALLTVNKAMKQLELDGYVVRRRGSGTYLASHEKVVRRTGGTNGNIMIACPDYFSAEYWTRVHLAHELALKNGMNLIELKIYENSGPEHLLESLRNQVDLRGVLIDPVPGSLTAPTVAQLDGLGIPVVLFSYCEGVEWTRNLFSVVPDWFRSGYERAKLFLEAGHRKLAFIHNEPTGKENGLSCAGVRQAMADYGLDGRELVYPKGTTATWSDARAAGYVLTREAWARKKPYGFIYDSVNGALGGLKYFWEEGVPVPAEAGMVSYGRTGNLEEYLTPPVSAVYSPVEKEIAAAFGVLLNDRPDGEKIMVTAVEVLQRQSIATAGVV